MYVIKDLVPDLNNFYAQYASVQPWLQRRKENFGEKQLKQSIDDRKILVSSSACHFTLFFWFVSQNIFY